MNEFIHSSLGLAGLSAQDQIKRLGRLWVGGTLLLGILWLFVSDVFAFLFVVWWFLVNWQLFDVRCQVCGMPVQRWSRGILFRRPGECMVCGAKLAALPDTDGCLDKKSRS